MSIQPSPPKKGRGTAATVARRREEVWRLKTSGRWSGATVALLAQRWGVSERMIREDLEQARLERTAALKGPELEQLRAEIAEGLRAVIDRGNAACSCTACKGLGYDEVQDGEPGAFTLCPRCNGSGTDPKADARVLKEVRQAYMDLAALYGLTKAAPIVAVQVGDEGMDLGGLLEQIGAAGAVLKQLAPGAAPPPEGDDKEG